MTALTVERPGPLTTVQDLGRFRLADIGVPRAGALDELAARLANRLVGNPASAAVLECTVRGPLLRAGGDIVVAVAGDTALRVDGTEVPCGLPVAVPAGATIDVGGVRRGVRAWIAVSGGIDAPAVLGSRSTDTLAALGGRALRSGDELMTGAAAGSPAYDGPAVGWPPPLGDPRVLRVVRGPHADELSGGLCDAAYTVTPRADRTGIRLAGPPLHSTQAIASHGLVAGAVQVPPDGSPVILLGNHQTTGGYPVGGVVIRADLCLAAQLRPGDRVEFAEVQIEAARAAWAERRRSALG